MTERYMAERRSRTAQWVTIMVIVFFCIPFSAAWAVEEAERVGRVDSVKSPATIIRSDGEELTAVEGEVLFAGDQITTGKGGQVRFFLNTDAQFMLGEEAHAAVDELTGEDDEDGISTLRLVLGYLWSKIKKVRTGSAGLTVHTPTAVLGLRGTEFETVVALDGASVVTVDEGRLDVTGEETSVTLDAGRTSRVEMGRKPSAPGKAIPRDRRDWNAWRKKRVKRLFKNLPRAAPRFREKFSGGVARMKKFSDKVNRKAAGIGETIDRIRKAKEEQRHTEMKRHVRRLRKQMPQFKKMVGHFRNGMNRIRVIAKLSKRVQRFAVANRSRFSEDAYDGIRDNLEAIARERKALRKTLRSTVRNIRRTFRNARQLKHELRS